MAYDTKIDYETLLDRLYEYEHFQIETTKILDKNITYDLFYFIGHRNKIIKAQYIHFSKREKEVVFQNESILTYIENKEEAFLKKFHYETSLDFKFIVYAIPRVKQHKQDFKKLYDVYDSITQISSFNSYFESIQQNIKPLTYMYAIGFSIYSSFFYLALKNIGIPIQFTTDINILLSIATFIFIAFLSILTIIPIFLLYIIHFYSDFFSSYSPYIIFVIYLIYVLSDIFIWTLSYKFIKQSKEIISFFLSGLLSKKFFIPVLGFIFFIPFMNIAEGIRFHQSFYQFGQPTFLYGLYHSFTGYPKIANIENKKYIVTGNDSVNYVAYDVNSTLAYVYDINQSQNYEQLCRNLDKNYNDEDKLVYELLALSTNNKPADATFLAVKQIPLTLTPMTINSLNIDRNALEKNCTTYLSKRIHK